MFNLGKYKIGTFPFTLRCEFQQQWMQIKLTSSSSHLRPLQVENCDNNSRLVVNEDDTGRMQLVNKWRSVYSVCISSPENTNHLGNICRPTMLGQRRRRWADVVQMLYKYFVFAGSRLSPARSQPARITVFIANSSLLSENPERLSSSSCVSFTLHNDSDTL